MRRVAAVTAAALAAGFALGGDAPSAEAAWTQKPGGLQIITRAGYFETGGPLTGSKPFAFTKIESSTYVAWGAVDWLTLGGAARFENAWTERAQGVVINSGFSDADVFARLRLWRDDWSVLSVQPLVKIPIEKGGDPPLGDGQVDVEMRVLYGRGFPLGEAHGFAVAELAYRAREGRPSDEARLDLTLGARPWPALMLLVQSFTTQPLEGGARPRAKLQSSVVLDVGETWSLELGGRYERVIGRDGHGVAIFVGVWRRF